MHYNPWTHGGDDVQEVQHRNPRAEKVAHMQVQWLAEDWEAKLVPVEVVVDALQKLDFETVMLKPIEVYPASVWMVLEKEILHQLARVLLAEQEEDRACYVGRSEWTMGQERRDVLMRFDWVPSLNERILVLDG